MKTYAIAALAALGWMSGSPALAQHADQNATRAAGDAFGTNIGNEKVGLYSNTDVRGFNPTSAGNLRLEGLYFDFKMMPPSRLTEGNQVRVGIAAQAYPFPAPTGIVDYSLRPVGDTPNASLLLQAGPNGGLLEFDAVSLVRPGRFGVAWAFNIRQEYEQPRDTMRNIGTAIIPRWRPTDRIDIRPFLGTVNRTKDKAAAMVFVNGPQLPATPRSRSYTPVWTGVAAHWFNAGVVSTAQISDHLQFRGGLMRFEMNDEGAIGDSYLNTDANGIAASRRFSNQRPIKTRGLSGEARLSGRFREGNFDHQFDVSLRGRDSSRNFGGSATATFANVAIGRFYDIDEPTWIYGASSGEKIRQWTGGLNYLVARRGLGTLGLGVQKIDYTRTIAAPGAPISVTTAKPLLWNGSISITPTERLAFYGAFTRGLEEAPVAPEVAVNAQEAPPAILTKQHEFGFRYVVTPRLRAVVGYFNIQKPYINLDTQRVWRGLGVETHAGVEASLSGEVFPGLNVVAGLLHMNPTVEGAAVDAGLIGKTPVGQPRDIVKVNLDYRSSPENPVSFEGALNVFGSRPVSATRFAALNGKQLRAPTYATLDLGVRYRMDILGRASTLRLQAFNLFDTQAWVVAATGGLSISPPRRYELSLATNF